MRLLAGLILMLSSVPAMAQTSDQTVIRACDKVEQEYGSWALDFRRLLERNSTDRGGRVDQSLITDFNFALVSARDFVHDNIVYVQRARLVGGEPKVADCRHVTAMARTQIEQYARALLSEVQPSDRWGRESLRSEFRMGLRESTSEFRGY